MCITDYCPSFVFPRELHIDDMPLHLFCVFVCVRVPARCGRSSLLLDGFSHFHIAALFLGFPPSPDGSFLTVRTRTGLPSMLKQLAQLHDANNRHRDSASASQHAVT